MTKKRTDGGHEIPEEDLREMEQEEGVKAKVSKMAKESIKVERQETSKKIYEE